MVHHFLTHFGAVVILHLLLLLGSWQVIKTHSVEKTSDSYAPGIIKLKMGAKILTQTFDQKVQVMKPTVPNKNAVKTIKAPLPTTPQVSGGEGGDSAISQAGTASGTSDGMGTGNGTLRLSYKAELRAKIDENKFYPVMSKRLGQTGIVVVAFTLLEDGNIVNVRIDKPSPFERLNLAGLEAVKKIERFKPIPKELGAKTMDIKVPVKFFTI